MLLGYLQFDDFGKCSETGGGQGSETVGESLVHVTRRNGLAEEGIDVALRIGPLEDSGLIVRKLDDIQLVVCATPEYLGQRGEPATPDDLIEHDCDAAAQAVGAPTARGQEPRGRPMLSRRSI